MKKQAIIVIAATLAAFTATAQAPTTFGIGISDPTGNLHVHSLTEYTIPEPPIFLGNRDVFLTDYIGTFRMTNGNTGMSSGDGFSIEQLNYDLTFSQHEDGFVLWQLPQSGKIWMLPGGRLGIGDTTTGYRLAVGGAVKTTGRINVGGSVIVADTLKVGSNKFRVLSNGLVTANGAMLINGDFHVNTSDFRVNSNGNVEIRKQLAVANSIYLLQNGDVTIAGNTRIGDGFYCDSHGNLKVKELHVTLTNWPDYVFGEGYRLMPLDEVEEYIGENGHLPQMPSAAEVEADGANLGEMNRLLLQKVEELTLYIIDLQKQIDELKSNK